MRRRDKLKNIVRANLLAEQRYLESKGVLTEGIYSLQDFFDLVYNQEKDLGEKFFVVLRNGNIKLPSNNEPFIDKAYLKQLNIYDDTEIDKIINLLSAKKVAPDMNTVDGRIQRLNDFFKTAGTEGDYVEMRDIYKHFKNNGEINNLPSNLRLIYNRAYKPFTKEEFMKIFLSLDKTKGVLNEGSDTYFETLSAALDHVREMAEKMGYELDEDAVWLEFGTGGISYGQTKSATIPLLKDGKPVLSKSGKELNRAISVSIYRMDSGRYELTAYKTF